MTGEQPARPFADLLATRPEPGHQLVSGPVSQELFGRLKARDLEELQHVLAGDTRQLWDAASEIERERLALHFGVFYGVEGIIERSGLSAIDPPENVHAMGRGPAAAGGDLYAADVVVQALGDAGASFAEGDRVLDFGCSSGRALRALAAWRPSLELHGCDPNGAAISWANEALSIAAFARSATRPPLPYATGTIDAAFAISIWSHYAREQALAWIWEMHRILRPNGLLLLTTHGWDALAVGLRRGVIHPHTVQEAAAGMLATGHHFVEIFDDEGDWGVDAAGWGNAYLTLDWLVAHLENHWSVHVFLPGGLDHFQDVIVLRRSS